jgi:uncharacterized protein YodC (DUF2158 family)
LRQFSVIGWVSNELVDRSIGRMLDMPFFVRVARPFRASKPTYGVGDVLKLKSGRCAMTVACSGPVLLASGNWPICQWFNDAGELTQEMFPGETLEPQRSKARLSHTGQ